MKKKCFFIAVILLVVLMVNNFAVEQKKTAVNRKDLHIQANMVFLYYKNLPAAIDFYEKVLGLTPVLDYGFAKAFRISTSAFVCLVDENKGMHKTSEPKTVTLSFITEEVDAWYKYLKAKGVKIHSPLKSSTRIPIRGFVACDVEGYFLEFETFREHGQNKKLQERLAKVPASYPGKDQAKTRPAGLGVQGNVIWLYYKDLKQAQEFYENVLGFQLLVDQGFAKVYSSSSSGFIGLVDEAKGLHRFSKEKSVNIGFFTRELDEWYEYLLQRGLKMRGPLEEGVKGLVRAFVTYDPAGYYLEFDKFNPHKKNELIIKILETLPGDEKQGSVRANVSMLL
jgi:catechol 2,3-dioxygenase-like lactoylglutathione lyase family enzyme